MKVLSRMLMMFAVISAVVLTSCSNDDNDLTINVVGTYTGDYEEGEPGASITIEDVDVVVTKVSDTEISLNLIIIPGLAEVEINATMDSETAFTVQEFELPDGSMNGTGSLQTNTLNLDLNGVGASENRIIFTGERN